MSYESKGKVINVNTFSYYAPMNTMPGGVDLPDGTNIECGVIQRLSHNIDSDTIEEIIFGSNTINLNVGRGLAIDKNGNIWAAYSNSNTIGKFDKDGTFIASYDVHGETPVGVGVDTENHIWINNQESDNVTELDQNGNLLRNIEVGHMPYTYSDMTGFNLRTFVAPTGTFTYIVDTQNVNSVYDSVSWEKQVLEVIYILLVLFCYFC